MASRPLRASFVLRFTDTWKQLEALLTAPRRTVQPVGAVQERAAPRFSSMGGRLFLPEPGSVSWTNLVPVPGRFDIELEHNRDRHADPVFHVYADLTRLEQYMVDIAPEDTRVIHEFIGSIRELQKYPLPPLWDVAPELRTFRDNLRMIKLLPFLLYVRKWAKVTNFTYAERFRNPFLREGFQLLFEGKEISIIGITFQLAQFDLKCAGYPVGGSLPFAQRLALFCA